MSDNDPFTLDMFGSSHSALSSGLGLGVTAFADRPRTDPIDGDPPTVGSHSLPATERPVDQPGVEAAERGSNFYLSGNRSLAKGWKARARENLDAISLAAAIAAEDRPATAQEQARLIRFTGFGASDLANAIFSRPCEEGFRKGWEDLGEELQASVNEADYASLARCTQYAHFTPEFIIQAIWKGLERLGW
ncbi:MAG: DNA methylase, partial [Alphaproteobacteria bacterium]|nr:DNA methylase [Alphaproteobacteria bacterium]